MFIIEKPYASEFMIDTIVQNDWDILDNDVVQNSGIEKGALNLVSSRDAREFYLKQEFPLIYANSENAISWVIENLPKSNLSSYIRLFKDKIEFRKLLKTIYPEFFFREVDYSEIKTINAKDIIFPFVIKPSVGFLSLGVHTVRNADEWNSTIKELDKEIASAKELYPTEVVNSSKFIIEELIEGDEYAIDAYYDRNGDVVILNIFEHPFLNSKDVSDRIYITSTEIMIRYMAKFSQLLRQIGELKNIRNFPLHIEVRVREDGTIIPIEINPMRFAGWCTTDVSKYAWGINVYEDFHNQKVPNWNEILSKSTSEIYYFSMAEVSPSINRADIIGFDYNGFLSNYSHVLEVRRINPHNNPLYAVVFGSTNDKDEIRRILELKTNDYVALAY